MWNVLAPIGCYNEIVTGLPQADYNDKTERF